MLVLLEIGICTQTNLYIYSTTRISLETNDNQYFLIEVCIIPTTATTLEISHWPTSTTSYQKRVDGGFVELTSLRDSYNS